jgi:hypothetical protein
MAMHFVLEGLGCVVDRFHFYVLYPATVNHFTRVTSVPALAFVQICSGLVRSPGAKVVVVSPGLPSSSFMHFDFVYMNSAFAGLLVDGSIRVLITVQFGNCLIVIGYCVFAEIASQDRRKQYQPGG